MYARVPSSRRYEMILKVTSSIRLVLNSKSKFRFMRLVSLPQYDGRRKIPWNINRSQRRSYCRRKILRFWVHPKLGEGTNMSVDSAPTSTCDGTMTMMLDNSSVASTDLLSRTVHHDFPRFTAAGSIGNSVGHRVFRSSGITHALNADALVQSLMDPNFPVQGLHDYNEWTLDLRMLNTGEPFAQGAFGKLYRGTYGGEDVAIKLLERPENDPERSRLMEHLFAQEVIMLASLRHSNIVRFIGACRNPMVWCIVTEFAKGGSVRQFLSKRQNSSAPLNITVRQALDVARGMAYIHSLGFIHMDLKSDNLLMWG